MSDQDLAIFEGGPWDGKEEMVDRDHGFIHVRCDNTLPFPDCNGQYFTYRCDGVNDDGQWVYRLYQQKATP